MGWLMGLEPTTTWTTTRSSNQLSYNHRVNASFLYSQLCDSIARFFAAFPFRQNQKHFVGFPKYLARLEGLEPPTLWAETTRSNPTELKALGAGSGTRTRISTLEGWHNSPYTIPAYYIFSNRSTF